MVIIFVIASIVFWVSVIADSRSSRGLKEFMPWLRDKDGRFSPVRHLIANAITWGAALAVLLIYWDLKFTSIASGMIVAAALARFFIASRNRKLKKK